jgi:D-glycero-alpha-D-manno-heptose-7-phosphate kinase
MVPGASVRATAPVRVADVGGWTDTWFGSPGQVCHLAVGPGVAVDAALVPRAGGGGRAPVRAHLPDVDAEPLAVGPGGAGGWATPTPGRHPLVEHAVAAVLEGVELPEDLAVDVVVRSAVPPGASLGTSASVVVAVLGALDALVAGGARSPEDLAALAHRVETERAGRQAGVQDQWAAAFGGAELLAIGPYPEVRRRALDVPAPALAELGERLVTVVFGPHDSSAVHHAVIDALLSCGGVEHDGARQALRRLSALAVEAAGALEAGEVDRWGRLLVDATDAQAALHPSLVGPRHQAAIDVAHRQGATGWKVNGAGGEGGSLTVVLGDGPTSGSRQDLVDALERLDRSWRVVDLGPAAGLRVTAG